MKSARNPARIGLLALGIALASPLLAAEPDPLVMRIQQRLLDYGYKPGPADGELGRRTVDAIKLFQKEFRLPIDGDASANTAYQLGDPAYSPPTAGEIILVNQRSKAVAAKLAKASHAEVINLLADLAADNLSKMDMVMERAKATIFVVDKDLKPGDVVMTQIEVIRADLPLYYENFYYQIEADTPTEPLVIINDSEAGWELQLTHRIFVNGELIGLKRTRAAR
jgi:peptidoglycan hydrolase-like protein with peptidoglycan-binding domain